MDVSHDSFGDGASTRNQLVFNIFETRQDVLPREENGVGCREEGQETILLLPIVKDLEFVGSIVVAFLVSIGIVPLAANGRVANGNGACHGQCLVGRMDDVGTNLHHGDVCNLTRRTRVIHLLIFSHLIHRREPHCHVSPWNANIVELGKSIVHIIVPNLGSDIPRLHSRQPRMIFHTSQWYEKIMYPMRLAIPIDKLSDYHGMIGRLPQRAGPKLGAGQCGRVNDPFTAWSPPIALL
mmetsp:Transcript_41067/g.86282  ORF Transcript_41067/g.86282 Transcript_41067/m.86282 type:complete len:238 (-) Transcript_41067:662-1375(-)